jgi:hypothetical protein
MLPACDTVVGAKLHDEPLGKPVQVKATVDAEENPFSGVTVTVSVPELPTVSVSVAGEAPRLKSGAGELAWVVALAWFDADDVPLASTASTT